MIDIESITNTIIHSDCMDILKQLPDKCCNKHNPKLDEDWKPFIDSINQRFGQ